MRRTSLASPCLTSSVSSLSSHPGSSVSSTEPGHRGEMESGGTNVNYMVDGDGRDKGEEERKKQGVEGGETEEMENMQIV